MTRLVKRRAEAIDACKQQDAHREPEAKRPKLPLLTLDQCWLLRKLALQRTTLKRLTAAAAATKSGVVDCGLLMSNRPRRPSFDMQKLA
jgi:hypothetical protein